MSKTFFISDTHFHHHNAACVFRGPNGKKLRPFTDVEEMDETMIDNWNRVVDPKDRVYHIGDFTMPRKGLQVIHKLNGRIAMILGNHDPWKKKDWMEFKNIDHILGVKMMPKLGWVITHIPVHERQLQGIWTHNIHGHLHADCVKRLDVDMVIPSESEYKRDKRYFNVSVERIDYTPIELEELKERLDEDRLYI